jgi:uncharacterized CHY-type Zn-finger protein
MDNIYCYSQLVKHIGHEITMGLDTKKGIVCIICKTCKQALFSFYKDCDKDDKYIHEDSTVCPNCGHDHIYKEYMEKRNGTYCVSAACEECKTTWEEIYELSKIILE